MKRLALLWLALVPTLACLSAPPIVVVDRATVLEEEASGSFDDIERQLLRAGLAARPVPLTPAQLEALGLLPPPLVDHTGRTAADQVDSLLVAHCIGEGSDGLLADTRSSCHGLAWSEETERLVDQVNQARALLWRWMQSQRPGISVDELRRAWQRVHARGVVCGGWRQREDGSWEAKQC